MSFDTTWLHTLSGRPELLTPQQMGQADAASPGLGMPSRVLMGNAGHAVARAIRARFRPRRALVLCGPGNNGGDGYIAARLLAQQGWPVTVAALAPPRAGSDAAWAAAQWHGPSAPFTPAEASRADLVIDAVFGAGLARDVDGPVAETLRAARRVIAVDVPSGLDGASGAIRGFAPSAALTVTFFRLKPGHLLLPGRERCGEIMLADIGLPVAALDQVRPATFVNLPELWPLPRLAPEAHKYSRGHVTVLGSATMTGAARLAADAARRAGAGMVTIAARGGGEVYRAGPPGLLVNEAPLEELLRDTRRQVWVCGPGLGANTARTALPALIAAGRTVVADADAFSAFAGDPDAFRGAAVLTPHAGEFARVFGPGGNGGTDDGRRRGGASVPDGSRRADDAPRPAEDRRADDTPRPAEDRRADDTPRRTEHRGPDGAAHPAGDRLAAARSAAAWTGAVVLLKGADTIVAAPDGRAAINASAPPWLATAGAGDVLAGVIAGLLAQRMPAWEAAAAGAWLHGQAAVLAGPGMVAEDLIPALTHALAAAMNPPTFAARGLLSARRKGAPA